MLGPAALATPLSTAGGTAAAASHPPASGQRRLSVDVSRTAWQGHLPGSARPRAGKGATAAGLAEPASAAPCQSGACQSVEERQRRQRLQAEMHQRAAAAAATGRAYHALMEQRERQRAAVAEEQERQRFMWAAAAAAHAAPRHAPSGRRAHSVGAGSSSTRSSGRQGPAAGGRASSSARHAGATAGARSSPAGTASSGSASRAANRASGGNGQPGRGQPLRDARFWMLYTLQWNRLYDSSDDSGDDCWGQGFSAAAATAAAQQCFTGASKAAAGFGTAADEFWREFVREAASSWRFQQPFGAGAGRQQAQQEGQQQAQQEAASPPSPLLAAALEGGSGLEQQVRAELAAMLSAAGGDLLRFVAALGVAFEPAADRRAALRSARAAFLLRLHPDKLRQAGEREQLRGLLATQVFNALWAAERARA